jgi:ABC-2 type transport system ATP-binding protein
VSEGTPVVTTELRKVYGDRVAVDDVSLSVEPGDVFGYLGPNGAGKTTSLRMMLGLILPTAGSVRLFGADPVADPVAALRGVAGFVEEPAFYPYLSGRRNLELLATLDGGGGDRIDDVLDVVELRDRAGDRVRAYSHGMRQRLGIAAALIREPRLLLLDEPTTGLDPGGMRDMRELVRRLAGQSITILLSTHLMTEVEALCNRVGIIQGGRIRYQGALADLLARSDGRYRLEATDPARALEICAAAPGIRDAARDERAVTFAADRRAAAALSLELAAAGVGIEALVPAGRGLEELFFEITEGDIA